jgi:integrase
MGAMEQKRATRQLRVVWDDDSIGERRLPPGSDPRLAWTLPEFFEQWMVPGILRGKKAADGTLDLYGDSLRYWTGIVGEPTLYELSSPHLGDAIGINFADELPEWGYTRRGKKVHERCPIGRTAEHPSYTPLAPSTAAGHASRVATILKCAGPRFHPRERTAEILPRLPLIPMLNADFETKPPFTVEQARATFAAASQMTKPDLPPGWSPELWWRARIATFYYTGLRSGTVLALAREHLVDVDGQVVLKVPGALTKTGKPVEMPLHLQLVQIFAALPRTSDLLLPEACNYRHFLTLHEQLQALAGLPPAERKSPHAWRRTHAVEMERLGTTDGREASRLALDHSHGRTTGMSYVGQAIVNELRMRLPPLF